MFKLTAVVLLSSSVVFPSVGFAQSKGSETSTIARSEPGAQAEEADAEHGQDDEYVRVCSTYGEGFFYIPGTETCLKRGGRGQIDR